MRARDYALLQIDAKHLPNWPNDVFRQHLLPRDRPVDPRDAALAENICVGVTKNLFLLQHLIGHFAQRPLNDIDPKLQKILAVALYQLNFLTRIPPSAAVNEAVEQTKRSGNPKAAGFVNAVLRRAARDKDAPLPDPKANPADYASIVLSHPKDVFLRFQALVGDEKALQICRHNNMEPPTIVRMNSGTTPELLATPNVQMKKHSMDGCYVVEGAKQATLATWADNGLAQVQDPTAVMVVNHCDLKPGHVVLDRCCGLGTKTLQLAERVGNDGRVVGIDPSASRLKALRELLAKRRIGSIATIQTAMMKGLPAELPSTYERALVDVPCSNSGVLARRAEARYHQDAATLQSLQKLQNDILDDTAPHVAPGGKMIYSTCSVWPEENQKQVEQFLSRHPDFKRTDEVVTLPSLSDDPADYHDGGYVAVLERA